MDNKELYKQYKAQKEAREKYKHSFWDFIKKFPTFELNELQEMDLFINYLISSILSYKNSWRKCNPVKMGIDEAVRAYACQRDDKNYDYVLKCIATWNKIADKLYEPLFDVVDDKGDDSYGDFRDAFPLAGSKTILKAVASEYDETEEGYDKLKKDIKNEFIYQFKSEEDRNYIVELILEGESYFRMSLEERAMVFFQNFSGVKEFVEVENEES